MLVQLSISTLLAFAPPDDEAAPKDDIPDVETTDSGEVEAPEANQELAGPAYELDLKPIPEAEQDRDKASELYQSATVAYNEARYIEAIEFFAQAYRTYPKAKNILFSLGQSHRRLFENTNNVDHGNFAILRYSQYSNESSGGERAAEVNRYVTGLRVQIDLMSDPETATITRVLVSTTAEEAWMKLDGGEPGPANASPLVEPGEHTIEVGGEGYVTETKTIDVPEGSSVPVSFPLAQMPALLTVSGPKGAEVSVDGRSYGKLPLVKTIDLEPGIHFVAVTRNGHVAYTRQIEVARNEQVSLEAEMRNSTQRVLSYALIGLGGASVITSGVMMGLAFGAQTKAENIDAKVSITPEEYDNYLTQRNRRDQFRTASITSGAVGLGVLLTGVVLFAVDRPQVDTPLFDRERRTKPETAAPTVAAAPVVGPNFAGAVGLLRF